MKILSNNDPIFSLDKTIKNIKKFLNKNLETLLSELYPEECINCGKINNGFICDKCIKTIKVTPVINKYIDKEFAEHVYFFKYENFIRKLLIDYKFNDKAYLRDYFAKIILKNEKICRKIKKYDIIIPVPIHKNRKRKRGYNQSTLICKKIVKELNTNKNSLKLNENILIKETDTKPQSSLNKEERRKNVSKVYKLKNKEKIKNKKIILFDDIYTTGATVNECSKILKENGAKEILVFTIAKD